MNKLLTGIVLLLLLVAQSSCKVGKRPRHKKAIVDSTAIARSQDSIKAVELNKEKQVLISNLTRLWEKQIDFKTFNSKVKAHYQGGEHSYDFTANIRIEKDKTIWVSVTALGMVNVARIVITPDSFKMVAYQDKKVTLMSLADAGNVLPIPVDFQVIQNMLMGDVLKRGGTITDANEFGGTWSLTTDDADYTQQYTYNKSDSTIRSAQLSAKSDSGSQGMIQQGNYEMTDGRRFSTGRAINMMSGGQNHYLDMNFNKSEFDVPVDFPFSIPKKYEVNGAPQEDDPSQQRKDQRKENKEQRKENKEQRKAGK
jgi:hypothetical protein